VNGLSKLELRVPPVLVVVACALAMWLVARALGPSPLPAEPRLAIAVLFVLAGMALAVAGIREFRVARTTVNPLQPEQAAAMVTSGIYRYTRNPMYLGMFCLLAAWAAWLGRLTPFVIGLPAFVLYMNRFQIVPEERALERLFGPAFRDYAASVRRWI
jgi:protein-S-isoprenylcysteine O-methyltransferase Ste14